MLAFTQDSFDLASLLPTKPLDLLDLAFEQECHYCSNRFCSTSYTPGPLTADELCTSRLRTLSILTADIRIIVAPGTVRCCYDKGLHAGATGKVTRQMRFEHLQAHFAYAQETWGPGSPLPHLRKRIQTLGPGENEVLDQLCAAL